jgi:FdhD protein
MDRHAGSMLERPHTAPAAQVLRVRGDRVEPAEDRLVGEEPLEIHAAGPGQEPCPIAVTMRTPGGEDELAAGFLITEGLAKQDEINGFEFGDLTAMSQPENEIVVRLSRAFDPATVAGRAFVASASCGICGKASIDDIARRCEPVGVGGTIRRSVLTRLPDLMRESQRVFERTGGLHAAALFSPEGELEAVREDIGRHNALDKLIGAMALEGRLPLGTSVLLVSGRVSFEIAQKAAMAGIPTVAAVSAPSDLSVSLAQRMGMTLVGFLRDDGFNVYTGTERIALDG